MKQLKLILLGLGLFFLNSCQTESINQLNTENSTAPKSTTPTTTTITPCGEIIEIKLLAGQNIVAGNVTIANDANNLYVTYNTSNGWFINKTHLYVGACNLIPLTPTGNPKIGLFPYKTIHSPAVTSFTYTIPLANLPECVCILTHAEVFKNNGGSIQTETAWGQGEQLAGNSWAMKYYYCIQDCDCDIVPGDYRTQTQGGWGAVPNGNNSGTFLHNNFAAAFPTGLTVGCLTNHTLKLNSANAVITFLPQGGTPGSLTQSYVDPTNLNNVLAGQLVALTLSIRFDETFPYFGASNINLGNLIVTSGPFQGWTVYQVLGEANNVFGGCSTRYTPAQINAILASINENFDNGTVVGTILTCPEDNNSK